MEQVHLVSRPRYNMYHFTDRFYIEPIMTRGYADAPTLGFNLEIDRFAGELQLNLSNARIPLDSTKVQPIDGLLGIIQLVSGPYLIVISSSISVGTLNGSEIYRVTSTELIPFRTSDAHLNEQERSANQTFVEMLESVLRTDAFYYSLRMDLSHTFQWLSENGTPDFHQQPLLHRVDRHFVWNARLCAAFDTAEISSFAIPLIHGFVGIRQCNVNGQRFKLALISRRSVQRAGVRFYTRGLDQEGNCANFVESEQIVEFDTAIAAGSQVQQRHLASFVQFRGSIPLFWTQRPNFQWQSDPNVLPELNEQFYRAHLNVLFNRYGMDALNGMPRGIVIVNLINKHGREEILGRQFRSVAQRFGLDNGDDCSKQYSGTPALKTDYTRTGTRTMGGQLRDGKNACVRYCKNNLSDGYRQDAINLFLGNYVVDRHNLPERLDHSLLNSDPSGVAFACLIFSLAMAVLCLLVSESWFSALFWLFLVIVPKTMDGHGRCRFHETARAVGQRRFQNGFFRTNCMDCLDRTNVVQSLLAIESLRYQLQHFGILPQLATNFNAWPRFVHTFKNLWADNGDDCSKQYSGTPALKTDYTRTGTRTIGGQLRDGKNAFVRYWKNNLSDGYRQDAINLFLGNYVVDRHNLPERLDHSLLNSDPSGVAFACLIFSLAMAVLCLLVSESWFSALFWLFLVIVVCSFISMNGDDFVDRPRLL
uniref:Phosphatidylinositol-3-phosphatase SAC1 n=1 Tax=Globodera pallida TaxID=36090 RepID=A0A183CGD0_GLOPA